jgi:uncharacterized membrane protein YfcA
VTPSQLCVTAAAGLGAGAINALAGGGTLLSFPALTAIGIPAVAASITNTVALCPGYLGATWAQRADLEGQRSRLSLLLPAGAIGGIAGGLLLLNTNEHAFRVLVPFLILSGSLLLGLQDRLRAALTRRAGARAGTTGSGAGAVLLVAIAAVYGGYFGAGLSVIVLAVLGLLLQDTLTRLNALKQAIALAVNLAAALLFVGSREVIWPAAAVMAVGALAGGVLGGRVAASVNARTLRQLIVTGGVLVGLFYLVNM